MDGVSLLPVLRNPAIKIDRPMYWRMKHRDQRALRDGDWKYLKVDDAEYLFNLANDERERANLAKLHPQQFNEMRDRWIAWNKTMGEIPPDATVSLGYSVKDMPQR